VKERRVIRPTDPRADYLQHQAEIDDAVRRVLDSGWYILGREVAEFEGAFAGYVGTAAAIGVGSGTDALHLALRACAIGAGDRVLTVSHTAVATVAAIELAGAVPSFVDIDPTTYTMDPNGLEDVLRRLHATSGGRPKAVIPVHLYGRAANMPAIMEIANRYDVRVIEDCAQSHGASIQGRRTGSWGHMAAFSFYPTKNLGALGDAGAVTTNDSQLAERVRLLREYGWRQRYVSELPGLNSRLDPLQAAVLGVKLRYLDESNERRRQIARTYDAALRDTPMTLPQPSAHGHDVYHQYVVRSRHRDTLRADLKANEVETLIHYPVPVHLQPAYRDRIDVGAQLPRTEQACREILSLPMHPQLLDEELNQVVEIVHRLLRSSTYDV
jgi:dTDP-4-amino-4,6-dideoxygalactose transaminase